MGNYCGCEVSRVARVLPAEVLDSRTWLECGVSRNAGELVYRAVKRLDRAPNPQVPRGAGVSGTMDAVAEIGSENQSGECF